MKCLYINTLQTFLIGVVRGAEPTAIGFITIGAVAGTNRHRKTRRALRPTGRRL